jgi:hypothetical protein
MKQLSATLASLLVAVLVNAQPIAKQRSFGNVQFTRDTLILTMRQVGELLYDTPDAYNELKVARTNYSVGAAFGFAGGLLMAVPLISVIAGGDPEWALMAGGAALVATSIPFNRAFHRRSDRALDIYNKTQPTARLCGELLLRPTGPAIRLRF